MAKKKSYASVVGGFGNVPGYPKVPAASKVQAPKAPAFKPVAPLTTTFDPSNLPVDAGYDQTIGGLTRGRDDTLAGLAGQKTTTLADYGYSGTFDDKGNVSGLTFDPKNPFSKAALLRKSYQENKTGTTNSLAARGQLYSGAMVNAQNANDSNFAQSDDALQKSLNSIIAGIVGRERTARTDYETGSGVAYGDRVSRAQDSPLYDPVTGKGVGNLPAASPLSPATLALIEKWRTQGTDYRKKK